MPELEKQSARKHYKQLGKKKKQNKEEPRRSSVKLILKVLK